MRIAARIVSLLLIVFGAVFAAQGANLLGGSQMTGDQKWLWIGAVMVVAGLVVGRWAVGRPRL